MFNSKNIGIFFGLFFFLIIILYTGIFINGKIHNKTSIKTTQEITDISIVDSKKVELVKNYSSYFDLDSNGNFNPKKSLTRMDAIVIVDKLAKKYIKNYNTTEPTSTPYFDDFKSTDTNADSVLRVVSLIDNKKDFVKHNSILGYQLKKQESITQKDFLSLLAVFFPVNKSLGEDYVYKNLVNYNFDIQGDLMTPITRENATVCIDSVVKNMDQ